MLRSPKTRSTLLGTMSLVVGMALMPDMSNAQALGERVYIEECASCHGFAGNGDSVMNDYLISKAPPLNNLRAENDGRFPLDDIVKIIDGRRDVRAHGSSMPIWGSVFTVPLEGEISSEATQLVVKGRILALAEYLESVQK